MSIEEERNKAIETIKSSGLKDIKKELRSDKERVMMAVKKRGADLQYVGEELKKDREFMLEIVKQNIDALKYENQEEISNFFLIFVRFHAGRIAAFFQRCRECQNNNGSNYKYCSDQIRCSEADFHPYCG